MAAAQDPDLIDEELEELETNVQRLRIEYDQYFLGVTKREPMVLKGKVQKAIVKFASQPPRNTRQRFKFNQLNSKFQVLRNQWGRILRQIESGTYKPLSFRANLHERERLGQERAASDPVASGPKAPAGSSPRGDAIDQLCHALAQARSKTGEAGAAIDRARLEATIRKQTAALRAQHGDAKIRFRVVVEGGKAKVRASVRRD